MKLLIVFFFTGLLGVSASTYSQQTKFNLKVEEATVKEVFKLIEEKSEFVFFYNEDYLDINRRVSINVTDEKVETILNELFYGTETTFKIYDRQIVILSPAMKELPTTIETETPAQQKTPISGKVTDPNGVSIPGVSVVVKGTTIGVITDSNGNYSLTNVPENATLQFSFVGMKAQEIIVKNKTSINVVLEEETVGIEEVVAIGYGTMKKSDLTGAVVRADIKSMRETPNVSVMQLLQGSVAGLNVGQVNQAGQDPDILIRGTNSISGESSPLIIVDNVIFRGNIIDLNPSDIESVDVLKDASSTAIYGSQASNGVILITTTKSGGSEGKPTISYSSSYSFQSPVKELIPGSPEDFVKKSEESDIFNSRTKQSGYLSLNPAWSVTSRMKTADEINAYNDGRSTDWYHLLTNDNMYTQNHNLSLTNRTKYSNYLISVGYTGQNGYMLNEDYSRMNARINSDNTITNWLQIGVQSFMTLSDYSGQDASPNNRYLSPYATAYNGNGDMVLLPGGNTVNPLLVAKADHVDKRRNFFGNIYAKIDFPFIKGLSYKVNLANNYRINSVYYFRTYASNFQGEGSKSENFDNDMSMDNILSFKRTFNEVHSFDITLVYGLEKRNSNNTQAIASVFSTTTLGYNKLQVGSASLQQALSGAWKESSLYNMGRLFYGYKSKYLFTGTIRRDGFSGFGEANKFGLFPSMSVAWVASNEPFITENFGWMNQLKFRLSYGSNGNRTIGRYQTLAKIAGDYNYITSSGTSVFTQSITSLASPDLKWETTTGINVGIDFGLFSRKISGSVEYYNNNTHDLLYSVDIPGITRYEKFPDNLGKLHNNGLEITLNSINLKKSNFEWTSSIVFSRNRNALRQLLGFDINNDGKEDDLISAGLFIDKPLSSIYTYKIDGKWQVNDVIPLGFDLGSNKVVDLNNDGKIDANDKSIIGYRDPSYRFSINNSIRYKNWTFKFFINSVQGGKNFYFSEDDLLGFSIMNQENHFNYNFPHGIDYWTPENPDAKYQRPGINVSDGIAGSGFSQRSFTRVQDISLSYDFPVSWIKKLNLQSLKFYISGKNPLTFTRWPGWDPETGEKISRDGLPVIKSYSIGINVEL